MLLETVEDTESSDGCLVMINRSSISFSVVVVVAVAVSNDWFPESDKLLVDKGELESEKNDENCGSMKMSAKH